MAGNLGDAVLHFKGDDSDLKESTSRLGDIIKGNLISSAIMSGINKVTSGIKNITSSITDMAVQGGFNRALNIEQAEFKLKGLGHSAAEVENIMDDALASVKGTAYGLDEAATVAASAVAAGVKPGQDLERTLKLVGDAATISGRDMASMGAIFNKVAAAGKMTGEELNQLTDSGIPMLQLLGDSLGKTTEEVRDMVSKGQIGFYEFRNAIEQGMGGAALTMGETFSGALANTKAAMSRLGKEFMEPFMDGMTPVLNTTIGIIDSITSGTTKDVEKQTQLLSQQLSTMAENVMSKLGPMISNALPVISSLIDSLLKTLQKQLPEITKIIISTISELLKLLAKETPTIIQMLITMAVEIANSLAEELPTLIPNIVDAIIEGILTILDNIDVLIDAGLKLLMGLITGILNAIPKLVESIPRIIESLINGLIEGIPKIIEMAPQIIVGIVTGLVTALGKIFEVGAEIISNLWDGICSMFSQLWEWIKSVPEKILGWIWDGLKGIVNIGRDLIEGLWNGIKDCGAWLWDKISSFFGDIWDSILDFFGIGSPSKLFEEGLGQWIPKGFAVGIEANLDPLQKAVDDMDDVVLSSFDMQPDISGTMSSTYSPNTIVNVQNNMEMDPLGQLVNNVKTFSGGAKNDYNWGAGV